ncbi:MAG TPA: hypothetical protein VHM23_04640 [Actinomycetota bacterium]|jgi:hypothetical protein|nr:hypothetical protein [Actinomycetota bacterium]
MIFGLAARAPVTLLDECRPAALALFLAGLLPGVAVTWALLRDIPIRNRLA